MYYYNTKSNICQHNNDHRFNKLFTKGYHSLYICVPFLCYELLVMGGSVLTIGVVNEPRHGCFPQTFRTVLTVPIYLQTDVIMSITLLYIGNSKPFT